MALATAMVTTVGNRGARERKSTVESVQQLSDQWDSACTVLVLQECNKTLVIMGDGQAACVGAPKSAVHHPRMPPPSSMPERGPREGDDGVPHLRLYGVGTLKYLLISTISSIVCKVYLEVISNFPIGPLPSTI